MEQRAWELLRQLSAKIPSVRVPVAALSGGQRQTVAIARSLIGEPRIVILDEPTAALGVAQTAEVLNLIERLRERGHGVVLISHNMADVQAVADRVVVLRLGRNNGEFDVVDVTSETLIAAITGAERRAGVAEGGPVPPRRARAGSSGCRASGTARRPGRQGERAVSAGRDDRRRPPRPSRRRRAAPAPAPSVAPSPPGRADPRWRPRIAAGHRRPRRDLERLPGAQPGVPLQHNLSNLTMQCAAIGTIALGIVLVLLVGEIDLSVGSVSGLAAAMLAVGLRAAAVERSSPSLAAIVAGMLVGLLYGFLYTRFGVPSFVITLAGLLGFLGLQLWVLGDTGSINIPFDSWIVQFAQQMVPAAVGVLRRRGARGRRATRLDAHPARAPARRPPASSARRYREIALRSAGLLRLPASSPSGT